MGLAGLHVDEALRRLLEGRDQHPGPGRAGQRREHQPLGKARIPARPEGRLIHPVDLARLCVETLHLGVELPPPGGTTSSRRSRNARSRPVRLRAPSAQPPWVSRSALTAFAIAASDEPTDQILCLSCATEQASAVSGVRRAAAAPEHFGNPPVAGEAIDDREFGDVLRSNRAAPRRRARADSSV